jgi:hypothetical protein
MVMVIKNTRMISFSWLKKLGTSIPVYYFHTTRSLGKIINIREEESRISSRRCTIIRALVRLFYNGWTGLLCCGAISFSKELNDKHLTEEKAWKRTVKTMGKISAKIHAQAEADIEEGVLLHHSEDGIMDAISPIGKHFASN